MLRGVAILAVFVQHLGDRFMGAWEAAVQATLPQALVPVALTIVHHAFWGVDLFFVLSGYTLAKGYLSRYARGLTLPAGEFLRRRAKRILPAFFVAVALTVGVHHQVISAPFFGASIGLHALLLQGYVSDTFPVLIGASWSLTTESHFYLVMPWLAVGLLRPSTPWSRRLALTVLILVGVWLSRALLCAIYVDPEVRTWAFELTQRRLFTSRIDQFVLGMLAAYLDDRALLTKPGRAAGLVALSVVAIVVAFYFEGAHYLEPLGTLPYALLSVGTATLVLGVTSLPVALSKGVVARAFGALGLVSYGVFLYHQLVLGAVGALFPGSATVGLSLLVGGLALGVSFVVGLLSFRFVERPFLEARRR